MTIRDTFEAAKRTGDWRAMVDAVPYAKFLGLDVEVASGELITTLRFAPHLIGNPALPALHGGTLGALLESAAIFELVWRRRDRRAAQDHHVHRGPSAPGRAARHLTRTRASRASWRSRQRPHGSVAVDRASPAATAHAIFLVRRHLQRHRFDRFLSSRA